MTAQFSIRADPARAFLDLTLAGFFTGDEAAAFAVELAAAHARLTSPPNRHVTLCDIGAMKVQPQEIVALFGGLLADPRLRSRRIAFVVQDTPARGQLRRALAGRAAACFDDRRAAERWLFARDDATIAA